MLSTFNKIKQINTEGRGYIAVEGEILKKYQQVLLEMAEDIISVCESNHIPYSLAGGNVLGAVRSGGFIPWDDDFDFHVYSRDISRMWDALSCTFPGKYYIKTCKDKDFAFPFVGIKRSGSIARHFDEKEINDCGIALDIFPFENTFDNPILRYLHGYGCLLLSALFSCRNAYAKRTDLLLLTENDVHLKNIITIKCILGWFLSFASASQWAVWANKVYSACKNEKSKYVSTPSDTVHFFGGLYLREDVVETVKVKYEGHLWNIPKNYQLYLQRNYGEDYMTPPDSSKIERHILIELKFPEN